MDRTELSNLCSPIDPELELQNELRSLLGEMPSAPVLLPQIDNNELELEHGAVEANLDKNVFEIFSNLEMDDPFTVSTSALQPSNLEPSTEPLWGRRAPLSTPPHDCDYPWRRRCCPRPPTALTTHGRRRCCPRPPHSSDYQPNYLEFQEVVEEPVAVVEEPVAVVEEPVAEEAVVEVEEFENEVGMLEFNPTFLEIQKKAFPLKTKSIKFIVTYLFLCGLMKDSQKLTRVRKFFQKKFKTFNEKKLKYVKELKQHLQNLFYRAGQCVCRRFKKCEPSQFPQKIVKKEWPYFLLKMLKQLIFF